MRVFIRRLSVADIVLLLIGMIAVAVSAASLWKQDDKLQVYIYKDDRLWGAYPLDTDRTLVIDSHNTVDIKNRKVAMKYSDCPDKRCVKQGYSSRLPIICLPNDLIIEVKKNENDTKLILY